MLHDPTRHEALVPLPWDEARARSTIERIVRDTEASFSPDTYWPVHPRDKSPGDDSAQPATSLYYGACGTIWALHYLATVGAVSLSRPLGDFTGNLDLLLARNRAWLASADGDEHASYMMGDTPILLLAHGLAPTEALADQLAALIDGNQNHPARELMWGSPGTMLAASFLHDRTGDARWAALFRSTAAKLWSQLVWSSKHECAYWTQDLYGQQATYLDAVHGFVATASVLIRGRHLLDAADWAAWEACIVNTMTRTATWEGDRANWRAWLELPAGHSGRMLMQFCHGAPGFVICLGDLPSTALDALLIAAGEAVWAAGPLLKGANLCHGTGGNGYAFLKLYRRTGDPMWLDRARAFAMHGMAQMEADSARYGQLQYTLWTGDPGFAIYLWDCVRGAAAFPTLDVFDGGLK